MSDELNPGRRFFGPSIDFSRVRVRDSRLVIGTPGTAWTCNNVIRFRSPRPEEASGHHPATLIHELGHVWQHQGGQVQLLKGFVEQVRAKLIRRYDPYDYGGPEGLARVQGLTGLTREAQAQIIAECWKSQNGYPRDRNGVAFTAAYAEDLSRLVREAGVGTIPAGRRTIGRSIDSVVAAVVNLVVRPFDRT